MFTNPPHVHDRNRALGAASPVPVSKTGSGFIPMCQCLRSRVQSCTFIASPCLCSYSTSLARNSFCRVEMSPRKPPVASTVVLVLSRQKAHRVRAVHGRYMTNQ
eukprot:scaffold207153_cov44-Tisochrysis_lutea.AAC.2